MKCLTFFNTKSLKPSIAFTHTVCLSWEQTHVASVYSIGHPLEESFLAPPQSSKTLPFPIPPNRPFNNHIPDSHIKPRKPQGSPKEAPT